MPTKLIAELYLPIRREQPRKLQGIESP